MGAYYVTSLQQKRRARWEEIFGDDRLPVIHPQPRLQALEPGRPDELAYDLDVPALHPMQRERLARHLASTNGLPHDEARALVEGSFIAIPAGGCELVEEGE